MYSPLLQKIQQIGDALHPFSGKAPDIGESKPWLTEHDIKTERALCDFIRVIDTGAQFFAEEEHPEQIAAADSLWVIDPISNTFNFIHGLPHYSVCVAHMVDGVVTFSAVYDPSTKELFHAEKGRGSFLNGTQIHVSQRTNDYSILIGPHLVPTNQERNQKTIKLIDTFCKIGTLRSVGSLGVQYAWVACGRAEAAISLPKDIFPEMAGKLLVEEAGGRFTDFSGAEVNLESQNIIASSDTAYEALFELLQNQKTIHHWNIYQVTSENQNLIGVKFRGTVRKFAVENHFVLLAENASDADNTVRFALLCDEKEGKIFEQVQSYIKTFITDAKIEKVLSDTPNPILSKLKNNDLSRYE